MDPRTEKSPVDPDATVDATVDAMDAGTVDAEDTRPMSAGETVDPGDRIGRYVVIGHLGAGAMGVVLAGHDPELDRKIAIKLLRHGGGPDNERRKIRLQREAQALARLNHRHVVGVHDVGIHADQVFVAMEFVEGKTLGAWAKEESLSWRDRLDVLLAAAEGLAAAHRSGLVHRDFKPDNVMVDGEGQARVMDFGLAALGPTRAPAPAGDEDASGEAPDSLTRTGAVMGTPAYMAPEQFAGGDVGAAADQFAFCVTATEILYGARPFQGRSVLELASAVLGGEVVAPAGDHDVPGWVWPLLRRGLSTDAAERWPSMEALAAELARGQQRVRRRRLGIGLALVATAVAAALGGRAWNEDRILTACADEAAVARAALWDADAGATVRQALTNTGLPYAAATVDRILPVLETYAAAWEDQTRDLCADRELHRTRTANLHARQAWCLDERGFALEALGTELRDSPREALPRAALAVEKLPRLEECGDELRLRAGPAPPERTDEVRQVLREVSRAGAMAGAGRFDESATVAAQALTRAEAVEWPPLVARARHRLGDVQIEQGKYQEAHDALEQAHFEARRAGDPEVALDSASRLVLVTGLRMSRPDESRRWARHAEVLLDGPASSDVSRRAVWLNNRALTEYAAGEYPTARDLLEEAIALHEQVVGPDHPLLGLPLSNLSTTLLALGETARAREIQERALELHETTLGPDHPTVAKALSNLANTYAEPELWPEAITLYERALGIKRAALGARHPGIVSTLNNLAITQRLVGDDAAASRNLAEAVALQRELGPGTALLATLLTNLAEAHAAAGDFEAALPVQREALEMHQATVGPDHADVGVDLLGLAIIQEGRGRYAESIAAAERSLEIHEAAKTDRKYIADLQFVLARARHGQGKHATALELARSARTIYAEEPETRAAELQRIDTWLAEASAAAK